MRIVVFTAKAHVEKSSFWATVLSTPGVSAVLLCQQRRRLTPASILRRQTRNIKKHGLFWIPYRVAIALVNVVRWVSRPAAPDVPVPVGISLDIIEVENLHASSTIKRVEAWAPDLGVSLGAPILKPEFFSIPRYGTINLHLGKVPEFRGAPPGFWELYTDAPEIGATVHWVDEGLDTGPVLAQARAPIHVSDTLGHVQARAEKLGVMVLERALRQVADGVLIAVAQAEGGKTYRTPLVMERLRFQTRMFGRYLRRMRPRTRAEEGETAFRSYAFDTDADVMSASPSMAD